MTLTRLGTKKETQPPCIECNNRAGISTIFRETLEKPATPTKNHIYLEQSIKLVFTYYVKESSNEQRVCPTFQGSTITTKGTKCRASLTPWATESPQSPTHRTRLLTKNRIRLSKHAKTCENRLCGIFMYYHIMHRQNVLGGWTQKRNDIFFSPVTPTRRPHQRTDPFFLFLPYPPVCVSTMSSPSTPLSLALALALSLGSAFIQASRPKKAPPGVGLSSHKKTSQPCMQHSVPSGSLEKQAAIHAKVKKAAVQYPILYLEQVARKAVTS